MKFNRSKQSAPAAADDTTEPAEPEAPSVPDDLAAEAERLRTEAQQIREQAAEDRAGAQERLTKAREEAAALIRAEETAAHSTTQAAASEERRAGQLEEIARLVTEAAARQASSEEAAQLTDTLVAEQEDLDARIDGLGGRLGRLSEEHGEVSTQLEASRQAGDVDAISSLRTRLAGIDDARTALGSQLQAAQERLDAIGTGQDRGELHEAVQTGKRHAAVARDLLNRAYPDRPEAVADQALAELRATIDANMLRIAEESKSKPPPQVRVVQG